VADESDNRYVLEPKVGSIVVIEFLDNSSAYVSMVSEVSRVWCKVGQTLYMMDDMGFLLKRNESNLKAALKLIIEAVEKIVVVQGTNPDYLKLQQALNMINELLKDGNG
jgi:hypothetical protein